MAKKFKDEDEKASHAYWLSPKGKLYPVDVHINFIRDNLELFGMTEASFKAVYKKTKEPLGWEGKARAEIIINAMKKGWIRIRDYMNKGWSVEVWELDSYAKDSIFTWAAKIKGYINEDKHTFYNNNDVNIHIIKLEQAGKPMSMWYIETSFKEILKGDLYESKKIMDFESFSKLTKKKCQSESDTL